MDRTSTLYVAQAMIAFVLSRLVSAGIVAVLVNGGFEAMASGARVMSDVAFQAQQKAVLSQTDDQVHRFRESGERVFK